MDIQKFKKLKISWLGQCPKCELDEHVVTTREGTENQLHEGDQVECWCGQTGIIETDGAGVAWCEWDKKPRTDLDRFNDYYREKFSKNWAVLPKQNHHACTHYYDCLNAWQEAKAQEVPEGFVLVPTKNVKFFSHDFNGDGFQYHDTLKEAKKSAEADLDIYRDRVADGNHIADMGEFNELAYGIVMGQAEWSVDCIVSADDHKNGEYTNYDIGTEILSLYLNEAQEQGHD